MEAPVLLRDIAALPAHVLQNSTDTSLPATCKHTPPPAAAEDGTSGVDVDVQVGGAELRPRFVDGAP